MTQQTEAQRLIEWIEGDMSCTGDEDIVAELRRLEAANTELLEALKDALDFCEHHSNRWDCARGKHIFSVVEAARASINKHGVK